MPGTQLHFAQVQAGRGAAAHLELPNQLIEDKAVIRPKKRASRDPPEPVHIEVLPLWLVKELRGPTDTSLRVIVPPSTVEGS